MSWHIEQAFWSEKVDVRLSGISNSYSREIFRQLEGFISMFLSLSPLSNLRFEFLLPGNMELCIFLGFEIYFC